MHPTLPAVAYRSACLAVCLSLLACSKSEKAAKSEATAGSDSSSPSAYLDKAASEPGAVKTASGLVYKELQPGTGASPTAADVVKVNYRGTLIDGTEFDSSYKRNEPAVFPLNRVIPCWTEGVQRMKVGGKSRLVCPSAIAYGDAGSPPVIPGGATLIFEIELLGIGPAQ
jgi:FKBP-type peptidyl-prolyl cis-trans isomerase FkpA